MTKLDISPVVNDDKSTCVKHELQKVLYELEKKDFNFSLRNQAVEIFALILT